MSEKIKVAIYPYNRKVSSLIRYSNLIEKYSVVSTIIPNGYNAAGKDVSVLEKTGSLGIVGEESFEKGIEKCDLLIVAEVDFTTQFKKVIIKNIVKAMSQGKDILMLLKLDIQEEKLLRTLADVYSVEFSSYKDFVDSSVIFSDSMNETYAPIILIAGLNEECQKFDIQLELRKYLMSKNYRVSQIGSKHYSEIFGFHSFPQFMYDSAIDINEKVTRLNAYVRNLERKEAPEVFVIGIPGGLLPITDKIHQYYGEVAFKTGFALQADACILAIPPLVELELNNLFEKVEFLLGVKPCSVGVSNVRFNREATKAGYQGVSLDIVKPSEATATADILRASVPLPVVSVCESSGINELFEATDKIITEYYAETVGMSIMAKNELSEINSPKKWLEKIIYKLFPDLDVNLGIEENWNILRANEILYIIAEITQKYGIFITTEEICNGATNTYQEFVSFLSSKVKCSISEN